MESSEEINLLHYSRICHLLLSIDDCDVEDDFTRFNELLKKYSATPKQVSRTFFGILYDEMYEKYTMSQISKNNGAGTIKKRSDFYCRALSAVLERHLQFEMMPYCNNQTKNSSNGIETVCAILRTLINLNCHNTEKQKGWIQQSLQVAEIVNRSDNGLHYPEDEANFIVAKCWNTGVTEAVKQMRFPKIHNAMETPSANVNNGIWYFETAIKLAELCNVQHHHLVEMYGTFRSSGTTTVSMSIQDEVRRILNP